MAPGPPYLFIQNKHYLGKSSTCIKNVYDIYFIKHINYFCKTLQGC